MKKTISLLLSITMLLSITAGFAFSARALSSSGKCGANVSYSYNSSTGALTISGSGAMYDYHRGDTSSSYYYARCPFYNENSIKNILISNGITSIGDYTFYGCSGLTSIEIPNSITRIGDYAFCNCSGLTSIEIPNSITRIGNYAFQNCSGLTSIEIPNSVTSIGNYAFSYCRGLSSIDIPNSVTGMGDYAFYNCSSLTSVEIPNSVTTIRQSAFSGCSGLTSITIPNSVESIGDNAFKDCSTLKELVLPCSLDFNDSAYSFSGCRNIEKVTLTKGTCTMPDYTSGYRITPWYISRDNCKEIIIEEGVTSIGNYAFYGCSGLTSIEISNSVTSIGSSAFYDCRGLTSIEIPNSVTSIGSYAFSGCSGLTSIEIPSSVTSIGGSAFYNTAYYNNNENWNNNVLYVNNHLIQASTKISGSYEIREGTLTIADAAFVYCGLTSIEIPNSVTSIGSSAFGWCKGLSEIIVDKKNIVYDSREDCNAIIKTSNNSLIVGCKDTVIPKSITSIDSYAFSGCTGLTSITIPNSVESIGDNAFWYCSGLTSIEIPNSVTSIGYCAFYNCSGLENVYYSGTQNDWNKISIQSNNNYLTNATLMCNYQPNPNHYPCTTHNWNSGAVTTQPTCVLSGVKTYTCTVCGATYSNKVSKTGIHTYDNGVITTQPTCAKTGVKTFTCTVCGATKTESVAATGIHTYDNGVITTQPTCISTGVKTFTCTVCGATKTESIAATGIHSYDNGIITTQPTCVSTGVKTFTCTVCGATKTESVAATGVHTYNSGVITTQPTCTKSGVKKLTCTVCGATKNETVAALGHDYQYSVTVQPNCEEDGYGTYTCSRCGNTYNGIIDALGHNFVYSETVAPTYTTNGYSIYKCTRCDEEYEDDIVEQLTLPYKTSVNSFDTETYKVKMNKSGYLVFDFAGESDKCEIKVYDEDYCLVTTMKPVFKEFYKKSYLQASQGSALPNENQIAPLLAGTYYIFVTCTPDDNYSGYFEMSLDYHASNETITETKYNFYYDALTATDIDLNKTYNGFLGGKYAAYTYSGKLIQTIDTRDAYKFVLPKGSGWSQLSVTVSTKDFPPLSNDCKVIVYNEDFEPCVDFTTLKVGANESKNEIAYLYEGVYYIAVSVDNDSITEAIEYTLKTECKPSGARPCIEHKYKLVSHQNATCLKEGYEDYECEVCGNTYRAVLNKTGHNIVKDKAVAATCTTSGKTEGSHCSVCGQVIVEQKVIKAAHKEVTVKGTPATFKAAGKTDGKKCKVCGKVTVAQKTIAKLGSPSLSKVTAGSKQFKATWKSIKNIDGYQIQYSTSSSFKSGNKTVTVSGYKSTSKTVKSLKARKKYYVRIRAYKTINGKKQYSAWSKSKYVTTKK